MLENNSEGGHGPVRAIALDMMIVAGEDVGLGGLGVKCSPRDPRFAGSNPSLRFQAR